MKGRVGITCCKREEDMADKVGVKENEYQSMKNSIRSIHQDNIDQIDEALSKLEELNSSGFHTDDLSPRIAAVIGEIRSISSGMSSLYSAHESIIESFQTAIENYDTCC